MGYSSKSKAYKCFNKRLHKIVESVNVKIHEITNTCNKHENGDNSAQKDELEGTVQPSSSLTQAGTASGNAKNTSKNVQPEVTNTSSSIQLGKVYTLSENEFEIDHGKITSKTPSKFVQRNHLVDQILLENRTRATRRNINYFEDEDISLLSMFEPKCFEEAVVDKF